MKIRIWRKIQRYLKYNTFINSIFILTQTLVTFNIFLHLLLGHFTEFEGQVHVLSYAVAAFLVHSLKITTCLLCSYRSNIVILLIIFSSIIKYNVLYKLGSFLVGLGIVPGTRLNFSSSTKNFINEDDRLWNSSFWKDYENFVP